MSTVKIIFNEGKINKIGEVPIWLRITKDRKPKYISLGVKVLKSQWNYTTNKVRKSHPNSQRMNNFIAQKVAEAEGVALEMESVSKYTTTLKIKNTIMGTNSISFTKFADKSNDKFLKMGKIPTYLSSKCILEKLKKYANNNDLQFFDITPTYLRNYEVHLRSKGNTQNTIAANMKMIRKFYNDAIREQIVPMEKNPFRFYQIRSEQSEKNYLTEEELAIMEKKVIDPETPAYHFRNLYVFAAYTGGIRISDLFLLKWAYFDGEKLSFMTRKTKEPLTIKVPNKGLEILNIYKTPDKKPTDFIFPFLNNEVDYSDPQFLFNAISVNSTRANKALKDIAKLCEFTKHIHFHTSRHTFATRALLKGMRIEYVSKLMAHSNIRTTQVYAKIVNEELAKAMDIFN